MDQSLELVKNLFGAEKVDADQLSPLMLAYVGDAVYELIVRTALLRYGNSSTKNVNRRAIKYVSAPSQARMAESLLPMLSEKETEIYKRGRNANPHTRAKNASVIDYRKATGYEALMGYLYLKGENDRLIRIVHEGIKRFDKMTEVSPVK